jgi:hypothetical protein
MTNEDSITVGLTEETHSVLQRLKDDGVFNEMKDGYHFGIAFAIAKDLIAPANIRTRTILNLGSLDPDGSIRDMVLQLFPDAAARPYRYVERLAEAGVAEMGRAHEASGSLKVGELYRKLAD